MRLSRFSLLIAGGVLVGTTTFSACRDAEFAGGPSRRSAAHEESPTPAPAPTGDPSTATDAPPVTPPPSPSPVPSGSPSVGTTVDTGTNTGINTNTDQGNLLNWIQLIGGLVTLITNVEIGRPDTGEGEIIFGGDKVFHIGDDNFNSDSECAARIRAYPIRGTRYFFEFEVTQDQTTVDVGVEEICGIDYQETDWIYLNSSNATLDTRALPKGTGSAQFTGKLLGPGVYTVVIESRTAGAENPQVPSDHDDFIVGKVHIKADKPIKPGRVGAQ